MTFRTIHTKRSDQKFIFFYFWTKTYVVGTQKNRLNETFLLSTQNIGFDLWLRKNYKFLMVKMFMGVVLNCLKIKYSRNLK